MIPLRVLWLSLLILAAGVCPTQAQLIEGPPGSTGGVFGGRRPVDPNRSSHALDMTVDLGGGYDNSPNLLFQAPDVGPDLTRWYASTGTVGARYRVGSIRRSLETRGSGFYNYQSNATDTIWGGQGTVNGVARFGRRRLNQLSAYLRTAYEPGFVFGSFGASAGAAPENLTVGGIPPQGIVEQRWLTLTGIAGYQHHWSARQVTDTRYDSRRVRPVQGDGLDGDWQGISVDHSWLVRSGMSILGGYRWDENRQRDQNIETPAVRFQSLDVGLSLGRRLSLSRRFQVTVRAGATRLMASPVTSQVDSLQPSFHAAAEFATSRFWGLSVDASRAVSVLSGVSALPVLNDNLGVILGGTPTRTLNYSLSATVARGQTIGVDPAAPNATEVTGVSGAIRYALATWSALFVSYGFYHHRIEDPLSVVSGFPTRYDRHSVRVGMTFWIPVYGAF